MKKALFLVLAIATLILSGCGAPNPKQYVWVWENSIAANAQFHSLDVGNNYVINKPLEGFWNLDVPQENLSNVNVFVATQDNPDYGIISNWSCDDATLLPSGQNTTTTSINNADCVTYRSRRAGKFNIAATVVADGTALNIPVYIYPAHSLNNGVRDWSIDFDTMTVSNTVQTTASIYIRKTEDIIHVPYGYAVDSNTLMSPLSSVPQGLTYDNTTFSASFENCQNIFGKVYIIKTAQGKYVKLNFISGGRGGTAGVNATVNALFEFLVSDANGSFEY